MQAAYSLDTKEVKQMLLVNGKHLIALGRS
jgi:hypothetical protein